MTAAVRVVVREGADHTLVAPQGRIYFDTSDPLRDALLVLGAAERPHLVLDLSEVTTCDSSGLNLLAQTHRLATRRGGWLRLVAPQPQVRRALEITNLIHMFDIFDTVESAAGHDPA
jgi:anti-anti-sigma factor